MRFTVANATDTDVPLARAPPESCGPGHLYSGAVPQDAS